MSFYSPNRLTGSERRESRKKMRNRFSTGCESSLYHHWELSGLGRGLGVGVGTVFGLQSPQVWFSHTDTTSCPAGSVYCLASSVPVATKAAGHKGPTPQPCMEHILLGLRTSQQGLIPRKDSTALVLHRARQASTKIHTCVGSGAMEQRLENMVSFLGVRTETQYSSAQSDWWPLSPIPKPSSVSLMSPSCTEIQALRSPGHLHCSPLPPQGCCPGSIWTHLSWPVCL